MRRYSLSSAADELRRANEQLRLELIQELGKEAVDNDRQVLAFVSLQYALSFIISIGSIAIILISIVILKYRIFFIEYTTQLPTSVIEEIQEKWLKGFTQILGLVMVSTGGVSLFMTVVVVIGSMFRKKSIIVWYILVLAILYTMQCIVLYPCYFLFIKSKTDMIHYIKVSPMQNYGRDPLVTDSIDEMQKKLSCCGIMGSHDYLDILHWPLDKEFRVPGSCCFSLYQAPNETYNEGVSINSTNILDNSTMVDCMRFPTSHNSFQRPCLDTISTSIYWSIFQLSIIFVIISLSGLLSLITAYWTRKEMELYTHYWKICFRNRSSIGSLEHTEVDNNVDVIKDPILSFVNNAQATEKDKLNGMIDKKTGEKRRNSINRGVDVPTDSEPLQMNARGGALDTQAIEKDPKKVDALSMGSIKNLKFNAINLNTTTLNKLDRSDAITDVVNTRISSLERIIQERKQSSVEEKTNNNNGVLAGNKTDDSYYSQLKQGVGNYIFKWN